MSILKYLPNGKIQIKENYLVDFTVFEEHCKKLNLQNPFVLGEYFQYIDGELDLIDRVGNLFAVNFDTTKYDEILSLEQDFIDTLNYVEPEEPEPPLETLIPQIRRDFENSILAIDNMEFKGDADTRNSLVEAIRFLEELGENAPETISWSAENGFFDLSLADLKSIAMQIGARRQMAFIAQKLLLEEVNNELVDNLEDAQMKFLEIINTL